QIRGRQGCRRLAKLGVGLLIFLRRGVIVIDVIVEQERHLGTYGAKNQAVRCNNTAWAQWDICKLTGFSRRRGTVTGFRGEGTLNPIERICGAEIVDEPKLIEDVRRFRIRWRWQYLLGSRGSTNQHVADAH